MHETSDNRAHAPGDEQNRHYSLGAPMLRQVSHGHLQQQISPEEDAGCVTGLPRIHVQFGAHCGKSHGDIGAIDIRDGVHHERDGEDAQPSLFSHRVKDGSTPICGAKRALARVFGDIAKTSR